MIYRYIHTFCALSPSLLDAPCVILTFNRYERSPKFYATFSPPAPCDHPSPLTQRHHGRCSNLVALRGLTTEGSSGCVCGITRASGRGEEWSLQICTRPITRTPRSDRLTTMPLMWYRGGKTRNLRTITTTVSCIASRRCGARTSRGSPATTRTTATRPPPCTGFQYRRRIPRRKLHRNPIHIKILLRGQLRPPLSSSSCARSVATSLCNVPSANTYM